MQTELRAWTIKDALELYNVNGWGKDFFPINEAGNVEVTPSGPGLARIDLHELVDDLQRRGLGMPLLIRFSDILRSRVETLCGCFEQAIREYGYKGRYRGVYPIKVNQQHHVVEELVRVRPALRPRPRGRLQARAAGRRWRCTTTPTRCIVCNGYKDVEYIETALLAQKLGR